MQHHYFQRVRHFFSLKRLLYIFGGLFLLICVAYASFAWYINSHKQEVLASVTKKLNENLNGTLAIGDMEPTFLTGFPRVSLRLRNVSLRDSKFPEHKKEFLRAGDVEVAINVFAFLRGAIEVRKISISEASVHLFTDKTGYSNTSIFKKGKSEKSESSGGISPELKKFDLNNVVFIAENQKANKLYRFNISALKGDVDFSFSSWKADVSLQAVAKSMSFNVKRGSFIEGKKLNGEFAISGDASGKIVFAEKQLIIGEERFTVAAEFDGPNFGIHIKNNEIRWRKASELLAKNTSSRLDLFDFSKPISVRCDIVGNFDSTGDPLIFVRAKIRDNELETPGGLVSKCNFDGIFTNHLNPKKDFDDPNSAVVFNNFSGEYGGVPFFMRQTMIRDFQNPYAKGTFKSAFKLERLSAMIDPDLIEFTGGSADIAVKFTADVVNYKLTKPKVEGKVSIDSADFAYVQRGIKFSKVSIGLDFNDSDLFIRNININSGKSKVKMDGKVLNFLNLYYDAPEKIVLNWNVYSPQLHLGEFMGYLGQRKSTKKQVKKTGNFTSELTELFEKSTVNMAMKVDKLYYNNFLATNATALVFVSDSLIAVNRAGFNHAGGRMLVHGKWVRNAAVSKYAIDASVDKADIRQFFKSFDNFGLESLQSQNLTGQVFVRANLSGRIRENGTLVPKSMNGKVDFTLKNGSLRNFDPVRNIGKYAFPLRDMNNIVFSELNGKFTVEGEKVVVEPMKISSSVLNLDVAGVYSFGKGTNMQIDVPLRNPKKDAEIIDKKELEKRRHRGVVLHLNATDDPKTGKVKIGLGKADKE